MGPGAALTSKCASRNEPQTKPIGYAIPIAIIPRVNFLLKLLTQILVNFLLKFHTQILVLICEGP